MAGGCKRSDQQKCRSTQHRYHLAFYPGAEPFSQIKIFADIPLIRETAIQEAEGPFDFTLFAEGTIADRNEPVGNELKTGGPLRYKENGKNLKYGLKKKFITGTEVELSQDIGDLDTNSIYFTPKDQAWTGTTLTIRQPLLKAFGIDYNRAPIDLANINHQAAWDEMRREVEKHLLEISRAYWDLYRERSLLGQKDRLAYNSKLVLFKIKSKLKNASPGLTARASSQVHAHQMAATQAKHAVLNAQARLRALVNDPDLVQAAEIVTEQIPTNRRHNIDYAIVLQTTLRNRPEVTEAVRNIQAAAVRLQQSKNESLPDLDLFFNTYILGMDGDNEYSSAYSNQFQDGNPSYVGGLRFENELGKNKAGAKQRRSQIELRQLMRRLDVIVEDVLLEAEMEYRGLTNNYNSMVQSYQIMKANENETEELLAWIGSHSANTAAYGNRLYQLMDANERLAEAEEQFTRSELAYNYSAYTLHKAMGILVSSNEITFRKQKDADKLPLMKIERVSGKLTP